MYTISLRSRRLAITATIVLASAFTGWTSAPVRYCPARSRSENNKQLELVLAPAWLTTTTTLDKLPELVDYLLRAAGNKQVGGRRPSISGAPG